MSRYLYDSEAVVELLSNRWWIPIGARPEGPKLEPEGPRAEVGFPTPTGDFGAFVALCLAFVAFKIVFDPCSAADL